MKHALLIILILSTIMAAGYAWATPVGQAPDEFAHLNYVKVLSTEHRLPVLNLEQRRANPDGDVNYEAHQPPLYYGFAVPFYAVGGAAAGDAGAGQAVRAFSVLCSLLATALIWLIARELAPERPGLWIAAAGFAALLPMRLHINSSVSNDSLAEATTSLALLLMLPDPRSPSLYAMRCDRSGRAT